MCGFPWLCRKLRAANYFLSIRVMKVNLTQPSNVGTLVFVYVYAAHIQRIEIHSSFLI